MILSTYKKMWVIIGFLLIFGASNASGAEKLINGHLWRGSEYSMVVDASDHAFFFKNDSSVGRTVFKSCLKDEPCSLSVNSAPVENVDKTVIGKFGWANFKAFHEISMIHSVGIPMNEIAGDLFVGNKYSALIVLSQVNGDSMAEIFENRSDVGRFILKSCRPLKKCTIRGFSRPSNGQLAKLEKWHSMVTSGFGEIVIFSGGK